MPNNVYSMKAVAPTVAGVLDLPTPAEAKTEPIPELLDTIGKNNRHLAILAPDGLGMYAWKLWGEHMPFLSSLHKARSIVLESIMPTDTGTNFGCMLTGAELPVHGMDNNQKKNMNSKFKCETLFDIIRKKRGKSVGAGQKGHCAELLLARFADFGWISERGPAATVTQVIEQKFENYQPTMLIAQFGNVDRTFHKLGPSDLDVIPMLQELDRALKSVVDHLTKLGVAVIILSDHGQHDLKEAKKNGNWGGHGSNLDKDRYVPCTWVPAVSDRCELDMPF